MCLRQQRRSRCDAHEHWREAMAFPCGMAAVSFPRRTAGGERGRRAKRGRARPACGSSSSRSSSRSWCWCLLDAGVSLRLCVSCVSCVSLCLSLSPVPSVPAGLSGCVLREEGGEGETELGVCARVGWVALVVDDRPVWDWGTTCVCGLTIDNDRATLGPKFSASGPRRSSCANPAGASKPVREAC